MLAAEASLQRRLQHEMIEAVFKLRYGQDRATFHFGGDKAKVDF